MNWRAVSRRALPFVVTAVAGFLIAYVIVALFVFPSRWITPDAKVPNVTGLHYDDAVKQVEKAGLAPARGESRYHSSALAGMVLGQRPVPGTVEAKGNKVVLEVSLGQRQTEVPRVSGMKRGQAQLALETAGLYVGDVVEEASSAPRGQVLSSDPDGGVRAPAGAAVDLVISRGPATVEVPDVVGQPYQQARNALAQLGLVVGRVSMDSSRALQPNMVVAQTPASGRSVLPGTQVHLTISGHAAP